METRSKKKGGPGTGLGTETGARRGARKKKGQKTSRDEPGTGAPGPSQEPEAPQAALEPQDEDCEAVTEAMDTASVADSASSGEFLECCAACGLFGEEPIHGISCVKCDSWLHLKCVNLTPDSLARIASFFCSTCSSTFNLRTVWRKKRLTPEKRRDKRQNYYEVLKIIKHSGRVIGSRRFLVRWKNYSPAEDSWVDEKDMDGCTDLLQEYLRANNLDLSPIEGYMGSSDVQLANKDNWLKMSVLLKEFAFYKSQYFDDVALKFESWTSFGEEDGIYFVEWQNHCYVVLYIATKRVGYIADGGRLFRTDSELAQELEQLLEIRLISCEYLQQTGVDHCVSSAILIGLGMIQSYRMQLPPLTIVVPKSWHKRITEAMHDYESKSVELLPLHLRRARLTCRVCGKGFHKKLQCYRHERMHNNN